MGMMQGTRDPNPGRHARLIGARGAQEVRKRCASGAQAGKNPLQVAKTNREAMIRTNLGRSGQISRLRGNAAGVQAPPPLLRLDAIARRMPSHGSPARGESPSLGEGSTTALCLGNPLRLLASKQRVSGSRVEIQLMPVPTRARLAGRSWLTDGSEP